MGEEEEKRKRVVVESLGWLTESTIMPKKHKAIEGVGASSILELKVELYKSQEEAKKSKELSGTDVEYHRAKNKVSSNDPFVRKNSGVDARAHQDKLALKAVSDGSASYAALEKKAELYEKLARGELPDEEDNEKYCVDFFRKGQDEDGVRNLQANASSSCKIPEMENGEYDDFIPFHSKPIGLGRTTGIVDIDEHKRFVREVHEEVNQAREKASELKVRRQEQATARREKLRQAYIRKQLEKVKSAATASKQDQT
ncbi:uncharacterized protein At4g18257-like [Amaranthus tricolor]|uniref:uncharacterized protein At4g18257-like n=1 Tax=Amaranthus tricolor TaxID=29722 RepID=UPI0025879CC5|nr:uncharacterized protein At4g18257-like [Amaranthus tricolor]